MMRPNLDMAEASTPGAGTAAAWVAAYLSVVAICASLGFFTARTSSIPASEVQPIRVPQSAADSDSESDDDGDVSALKNGDDCKLVSLLVRAVVRIR